MKSVDKQIIEILYDFYNVDVMRNFYPLQTDMYIEFNKDFTKIITSLTKVIENYDKQIYYCSPIFLLYRKEYNFNINIRDIYEKQIKKDFLTYKSQQFVEEMKNGYIIYSL